MRVHFEAGETAVTIIAEKEHISTAEHAIFEAREIIQKKIGEDPFFGTTFDPYPPSGADDDIIRRMCQASELAGVGPMAGVAGAVAVSAVEAMKSAGAGYAIVENGGDIALMIDRDITVGIFADDPKLRDLALRIPRRDGIFGICSSSGRVGPSVSLGTAGIATVFSDDVILADACATALGNLIKKDDPEGMSSAAERIGSVEGVEGCLAVCGGMVAMFGDVPELIKREVDPDRASRIIY